MMSSERSKGRLETDRIAMADAGEMTEAQQGVYNRILTGKRKEIVGPLRVALHSPELADHWQAFGEFLRFGTSLPAHISELAIITTGRYWNCQVEWLIHSAAAEDAGLDVDVIESIRKGEPPVLGDSLERLVYEFCRELLEYGQVSDSNYDALLASMGEKSIVELTAVVGYYSMVAMTLNVHAVPVPDRDRGSLLDLPEGGRMIRPARLVESIGTASTASTTSR